MYILVTLEDTVSVYIGYTGGYSDCIYWLHWRIQCVYILVALEDTVTVYIGCTVG